MKESTDLVPVKKRPATHRHASRANAFFQVAGSFVPNSQSFGISVISIKTMQMLVSAYTALNVDNNLDCPQKTIHRLLHVAQVLLSGGLIGLNIAIYLQNEECLPTVTTLCQTAIICENLYKGIMLTSYFWSESKLDKKLITALYPHLPGASAASTPAASPRDPEDPDDFDDSDTSSLLLNLGKR